MKILGRTLSIIITVMIPGVLVCHAQQQIVILWNSKQPQSPPITVDQVTPVHIVVTGVNDVLYKYEGFLTAEPKAAPTFLGPVVAAAASDCSQLKNQLQTLRDAPAKNWQLNPWLNSDNSKIATGGTPHSVSLTTTQS